MSRKGSRKEKPLIKEGAMQGGEGKIDDKQIHDNLGYNSSDEDNENDRKMLVIHEGDPSCSNEAESEQRSMPSGARAERESIRRMHNNLPEDTEDNQYSTLSRTNKHQSGETFNPNTNVNTTKNVLEGLKKQSETEIGSNTKKPEKLDSTLKITSPKEEGLYNPYAVDNINIDDFTTRKMDDKQTKTAIYDTIGDKKGSENDYSTLNRESKPQKTPNQQLVPALKPGGRAIDNEYSSLHSTPKRTTTPQRLNSDVSKNKFPHSKSNETTYATVGQRKEPENAYNTLDRTLSQENFLNRASWTSTDSLLYNPYAVDDTESVSSDKRNISNPLYNHLLYKPRAEIQSSALGGVSTPGSIGINGSAINYREARANLGFVDENEGGLYSELTNYQQGAVVGNITETSEASAFRILQHNYCVSFVLFVVLFLSVLALLFVMLTIAGKAGPGCLNECSGSLRSQQSKFFPDGSSLLELIQQLRQNVSASNTSSAAAMETAKINYDGFIQEEYKLNRTVLELTQTDKDNNKHLLVVNESAVPGTTELTTKVETSLDSLKTQDNNLHLTFAKLNLIIAADESQLYERVNDTEVLLGSLPSKVDKINSTLVANDIELLKSVESWNSSISEIRETITNMVQGRSAAIYLHLHSVNSTQTTKDSIRSNSLENLGESVMTFNASLITKIEDFKNTFEFKDGEVRSTLVTVNTTLDHKIYQISQMRGPNGTAGLAGPTGLKGDQGNQGKDGPGDLSRCSYHFRKSSPGSTPTDVVLPDSYSTLSGKTIVGLVCSSDKDNVKTRLERSGSRWDCLCESIKSASVSATTCFVHYWVCPTS